MNRGKKDVPDVLAADGVPDPKPIGVEDGEVGTEARSSMRRCIGGQRLLENVKFYRKDVQKRRLNF